MRSHRCIAILVGKALQMARRHPCGAAGAWAQAGGQAGRAEPAPRLPDPAVRRGNGQRERRNWGAKGDFWDRFEVIPLTGTRRGVVEPGGQVGRRAE